MRMKILITEEQYRLLKEDNSYDNVVNLLMDPEKANREIALFLIKTQGLGVSEIASKILEKKNISSFEDLDSLLKSRNGNVFLPIKLLNDYVGLHTTIKKSGSSGYKYQDLNVEIYSKSDSKRQRSYKKSILIYSNEPEADIPEEEEYFEFLEDIIKYLLEIIKNVIIDEINNLPEETE